MDLFGFSIPYLAEQVTNMLFSIVGKGGALEKLSTTVKGDSHEMDFKKMLKEAAMGDDEQKKKQERKEALRNKIKAVARLHRIFRNLR